MLYFRIIIILCFSILASCSNNVKEEKAFTEKDAMDKFTQISMEQGALFYAENREKYDFLDDLYVDSILPVIVESNYYDLKKVYLLTRKTPFVDFIEPYYNAARSDFLEAVKQELKENTEIQKDAFVTEVLPLIEIEVDSMLNADIEKVIDEYAGGILNYKKLYFFTGRNTDDFKNFWNDNIDINRYREHICQHINSYFEQINEIRKQYCKNITGRNFNDLLKPIELPLLSFALSEESIQQIATFIQGEKDAITKDALKDWIAPIIIGGLTDGTGTALYEIGTLAYDVKVTIDDLKLQKLSPEEQLQDICSNQISTQIMNEYLSLCTQMVLEEIEESNHKLFSAINIGL